MKLNARTIAVIGGLIFIVAIALLYLNYQNQNKQLKTQQASLDSVNAAYTMALKSKTADESQLAQIQDQISQLQSQVTVTQKALIKKAASLPKSLDGINYSELFSDTADSFNVQLSNITNGGTTSVTMDSLTFSTISFSLSLQGNRDDLLSMLDTMVNGTQFRNAAIESISFNRSKAAVNIPGGTGQAATTTTAVSYSTDLKVTFYGYSGS